MLGSWLLLPVRLGLRATGLVVRGAREIVERVAGVAHDEPPVGPDFESAPPVRPTRAEPPARPIQTQTAGAPPLNQSEPVDYDAPAEAVAAHVDEGSELVDAVAEPGAEDGAGAQVRVAEPWEGYRGLRAAEVIARLGSASAEELAAIELYELTSRKRRTVIAAAHRELARRR